jgi:hypothetical protein
LRNAADRPALAASVQVTRIAEASTADQQAAALLNINIF